MQFGYDPKKKKRDGARRDSALKWQEDPLYGFPNDIEYFNRDQIEAKISVSKRFGNKILSDHRWDKDRGAACLGRYGAVARRCSMNDKLWGIWQAARRKGIALKLEDVKKMILIDIKRSRLYPPGWRDADANPPQWYIDKLQAEGKLEQIFKEIGEATSA